jgi:DNA mismatch repair ATPase MutS
MDSINIDDFARKLIADKCSALIESERMLPDNILSIVKNVRDEYLKNPTPSNYENIKKLFNQTKYVDDAIDYKDFNRRILLIAFKFGINKSKDHFKNYSKVLDVALRRLDKINPDLKSSPRAMLQHYNECLDNLDNANKNDEHHLITFAKEIATKIFIETIDLYSNNNKSPIEMNYQEPTTSAFLVAAANNIKRKKIKPTPSFKIVTPLFQL